MAELRIGAIAQLLGVTAKTIRHYHKLGLVAEPKRSEGGYRLYNVHDLLRLQRIRRLQALGLSLQQIKFIFEAESPDGLLRTTLEAQRLHIIQQQRKLAERREHIETFLKEKVSLTGIEAVESPTLQMLTEHLGEQLHLPPAAVEFDRVVFSRLDAVAWGEEHQVLQHTLMEFFTTNPTIAETMATLGERLMQLAEMPEDAPEITRWAEEVIQSGLLDSLRELSTPITQANELMGQIIEQSAQELMSPAQLKFLQLLR